MEGDLDIWITLALLLMSIPDPPILFIQNSFKNPQEDKKKRDKLHVFNTRLNSTQDNETLCEMNHVHTQIYKIHKEINTKKKKKNSFDRSNKKKQQ